MKGEMRIAPYPWTPEDDERLRKLAAEGRTSITIAERMKRTPESVRRRAKTLKVVLMKAKGGRTSPHHVGPSVSAGDQGLKAKGK
jgi:hypothetical protein